MTTPWYTLIDDDEWIDDINLHIVPRFKESELSGDEWRVSAVVEFSRKGRVVKTESYHDLRTALAHIAHYSTGMYPGSLGIMGDVTRTLVDDYCMQPGCPEPWTVEYKMKTEGCGHCGTVAIVPEYSDKRRRFCDKHKQRGDSSLDDSDRNYEVFTPEPQAD